MIQSKIVQVCMFSLVFRKQEETKMRQETNTVRSGNDGEDVKDDDHAAGSQPNDTEADQQPPIITEDKLDRLTDVQTRPTEVVEMLAQGKKIVEAVCDLPVRQKFRP